MCWRCQKKHGIRVTTDAMDDGLTERVNKSEMGNVKPSVASILGGDVAQYWELSISWIA